MSQPRVSVIVVSHGRPHFATARRVLSKTYGLVLPNQSGAQDWSLEAQRAGFLQFLKFLGAIWRGKRAFLLILLGPARLQFCKVWRR